MADKEKTRENTTDYQSILVIQQILQCLIVVHKLPLYTLLACGYDTLDAIVELNVHEPGLNDIDRMCRF